MFLMLSPHQASCSWAPPAGLSLPKSLWLQVLSHFSFFSFFPLFPRLEDHHLSRLTMESSALTMSQLDPQCPSSLSIICPNTINARGRGMGWCPCYHRECELSCYQPFHLSEAIVSDLGVAISSGTRVFLHSVLLT